MLVFAPGGIGEIAAGDDLAAVVIAAVAADPQGPLPTGDIVGRHVQGGQQGGGAGRRPATDRDDGRRHGVGARRSPVADRCGSSGPGTV